MSGATRASRGLRASRASRASRPSRPSRARRAGALVAGLAACAGLLVHAACGGTDESPTDAPVAGEDASDGADDAAANADASGDGASDAAARAYHLAATGVRIVVKGPSPGIELGPAELSADVDLVAFHQDFFGVPWQAFEKSDAPPAAWVAKVDAVVASAKAAGKGVFLSITPLSSSRDTLAPEVAADGSTVERWAPRCYDFRSAPDGAEKRAAYVRYVTWMIDRVAPSYLAVGIEVNLFAEKCPGAWEGMVDALDDAYDAAKAKAPGTVVFETFELGHLLGYDEESCPDPAARDACFEAAYAKLARLRRDRFGISSYPYGQGLAVADLPADWFSKAPAKGGEQAVIGETGWLSTPLVVETAPGSCFTVIESSEANARAYMDRVLDAARTQGMDLVTWWSDRDVLDARLMTDCPCTFDADWCALRDAFRDAGPDAQPPDGGLDPAVAGELGLKAFGSMGLRAYDGAPKPLLLGRWQQALAGPTP